MLIDYLNGDEHKIGKDKQWPVNTADTFSFH